jgi:site-specific DNA-methyltransferase (adenine-specific)
MTYQLYNQECVSGMKKHILDSTVNLTVTSPPYDNLREYNNNTSWNFEVFKQVAQELYRVTKSGGVVMWNVGDSVINGSETGSSFRQALYFIECGFNLHDTMIYEKNSSSFPARHNGNRYTQIFEYMFILSKGKPSTVNLICDKKNRWAGHTSWGITRHRGKDGELKGDKKIKPVPDFSPRNNIWKYNTGKGFSTTDKIAHQHPAIFPEKLALDHILTWSNPDDMILDPFSGSGTTAKMSILNNRNFVGFEIDESYFKISNERLSKY